MDKKNINYFLQIKLNKMGISINHRIIESLINNDIKDEMNNEIKINLK
jgi:hypothetical protein